MLFEVDLDKSENKEEKKSSDLAKNRAPPTVSLFCYF